MCSASVKTLNAPGPAKAAITLGRRRNAGNVWNVSMETPHLSLVRTDVLRVKVELMWSLQQAAMGDSCKTHGH